MKLEAGGLLRVAAAGIALALIVLQGAGAPRGFGSRARFAAARPDDPYVSLERQLQKADPVMAFGNLRDPFGYVARTTVAPPRRKAGPAPAPPPASQPLLTAIIWDSDPRAMLRWNGHDYTVRTSSVFADYQVVDIHQDRVTLAQHDRSLVLTLPTKGD
jgi:hypothetical protein